MLRPSGRQLLEWTRIPHILLKFLVMVVIEVRLFLGGLIRFLEGFEGDGKKGLDIVLRVEIVEPRKVKLSVEAMHDSLVAERQCRTALKEEQSRAKDSA